MREKQTTRQYMVNIHGWRSKVALFACIVTLVCASTSIVLTFIWYVERDRSPAEGLRYFTTISNMITLLASTLIIPFAINGIVNKRFVIPKWLSLLFYSGTICTTMVFVFAVVFILPYNPEFAIGGKQIFLHVVCPIAVFVCFQLVEAKEEYSLKEKLLCLVPFVIYSFVYTIMVVIIGKENGGWPDMYMLNTLLPAYITFPMMWIVAFLVAGGINKISDVLKRIRERKMFAGWKADADPVEVNIEVYGLGRYYGLHGGKNNLTVPLDIIESIAKKNNRNLEDLYNIYTKGLLHGIEERSETKAK